MAFGSRLPGEFNQARGATDALNKAWGPLGDLGPTQAMKSRKSALSQAGGSDEGPVSRTVSDQAPNNMFERAGYAGQNGGATPIESNAQETNRNQALNRGPIKVTTIPRGEIDADLTVRGDEITRGPQIEPIPAYHGESPQPVPLSNNEGPGRPRTTQSRALPVNRQPQDNPTFSRFSSDEPYNKQYPQPPPWEGPAPGPNEESLPASRPRLATPEGGPAPVQMNRGEMSGASPLQRSIESAQGPNGQGPYAEGAQHNGPQMYEQSVHNALDQMNSPRAPVGPNSRDAKYSQAQAMLTAPPDPTEVANSELHHMGIGGRFKQVGLGILKGLAIGGPGGAIAGGILGGTGDIYKTDRESQLSRQYARQHQAGLDYLNVIKSQDAADAAEERAATAEERNNLTAQRNQAYAANVASEAENRTLRAQTADKRANTDKDYKENKTRQGYEGIEIHRAGEAAKVVRGEQRHQEAGQKSQDYRERTDAYKSSLGAKGQSEADRHEDHVTKKKDKAIKENVDAGKEDRIKKREAKLLEQDKARNPKWNLVGPDGKLTRWQAGRTEEIHAKAIYDENKAGGKESAEAEERGKQSGAPLKKTEDRNTQSEPPSRVGIATIPEAPKATGPINIHVGDKSIKPRPKDRRRP